MKKIVMGMAALACAASMFAVDVAASLKFNGSLFDMTFIEGAKPTVLKLEQPKAQKGHGQTGIDVSVTADKAGATLILGNGYSGSATLAYQGFKMWVQPADFLKLNLGSLDYCLNKESIDYAGCINGTATEGIATDLTFGGLSASLIFNPGYGKVWFDGEVLGNTEVYVKYGADFGTVGFAWLGSSTAKTATEAGKIYSDNTFSLGYSGNFGPVSAFADAALIVKPYETKVLSDVKADLFVKANIDALSVAAYADFGYDLTKEGKAAIATSAKAKVSYNLGVVSPYLYVKDPSITADKFQMEVKPGVTFNVGSASFDVAVDVQNCYDKDNNKNCDWKLSVPFGVSVNF